MSDDILSFQAFITMTHATTFADFSASRVSSATEFAKMKAYLLEHYAHMHVVKSILVGGQVFDCVLTRDDGETPTASSDDEPGCPDGTIPVRRITLSEMTRFRTLNDFFGKSPGGKGILPN